MLLHQIIMYIFKKVEIIKMTISHLILKNPNKIIPNLWFGMPKIIKNWTSGIGMKESMNDKTKKV